MRPLTTMNTYQLQTEGLNGVKISKAILGKQRGQMN